MGSAVDRLLQGTKGGGGKQTGAAKSKGKPGSAVSALLGKTGAAPATGEDAPKKSKSILGRVASDAGNLVSGVPKGLLGFGQAVVEAPNAAKQIVQSNVQHGHVPFTPYKPGQEEAIDAELHKAAPHLFGLVDSNAQTLRDVGGGRLLTKHERAAHTEDPKKLYSEHPLSAFVGDAANISIVAGPALKAAGAGAEAGSVAAKAGKVGEVASKVADAPTVPFRAAAKLAGKGYEAAAASEGRVGSLLRATRMDPASRLVRNEVLNPAVDKINEHTSETVARAQKLEQMLPDKNEQIAATLVGEGEAEALASLRRHLSSTDFEAHIVKTFGDSVPAAAANIAADLAEARNSGHGYTPREQRIVDAIAEGAHARSAREQAYVGEGVRGREQEVRGQFAPLSKVVDDAAKKPEEAAARAARLAGRFRDRADLEVVRAGERVTGEPRLASAGRSAEAAAKRFSTAQRRVAETAGRAREALAHADGLEAGARKRLETRWRQALEGDIRDYRRAHAEQLRAQADDLMSQLPDEGPAMPGKWLDRAQGVRHPSRDIADSIAQSLGEGYAGRKFFTGKHGLDVYLDEVNRRLGVTDEAGSGVGQQHVADVVTSIISEARRLRREAQAVERGHLPADTVPAGAVRDVAAHGVGQLGPKIAAEHGEVMDRAVSNAARLAEGSDAALPSRLESGIARSIGASRRVDEARGAENVALEGLNRPIEAAAEAGRRVGQREGASAARVSSAVNIADRADALARRVNERAVRTRAEAEQSIAAAPARLRPVLQRNREAAAVLNDMGRTQMRAGNLEAGQLLRKEARDLPKTLDALKASGVDFDHFIHVEIGDKPTSAGVPGGPNLPKIKKGREQRVRTGSASYDRTVRAQAQGELDMLKNGVAKQAAEKIGQLPFARKFGSVAEAKAEGFVAWDPKSPFEKSAQITKTTTFVPEHIFEGFRSYFNDPRFEKILQSTWDPATRVFKVSVLALSPSWQVGNVIGNTMLATVGAGVNPARLAIEATKALRDYKRAGSWEGVAPRRLFSSGATHEEFGYLHGKVPEEKGRLGRAINKAGAPARASYRANEFVDNLTRSAVYTAKLRKGVGEEVAVKQALHAMGDFSRMTPFERRVVKRVVPFYAWQRHITQLAFRLPVESPMRTAWILHLADVYGKDDDGLPGALKGSLKIPGTDFRLGTTGLNPFGRLGVSLDPGKLPQSINPLIKIPYQSATGTNLYNNKPFTRPPGSGKHDDYGRPVPTAPSLLHQVAGLSPQKRLFDAVTGRDSTIRYDTGDPILTSDGPLKGDRSRAQALARFFGFPLYAPAEIAGMQERTAANQQRESQAAAGYSDKKDVADTLPYAPGAKKSTGKAKTKKKSSGSAVDRLLGR